MRLFQRKMPKRLILHIGHSKTGSSSIQHVLHHGMAQKPGTRLLFAGFRNDRPLALTLGPEKDRQEERFTALRDRLDQGDWDVAVISSEQFEWVRPDLVRAAFERWLPNYVDMLEVIAYVRPHVGRLVASHTEAVKLGWYRDDLRAYHGFMKGWNLFYYARKLGMWRDQFGDALTVRPMIRSELLHGDVVQDFFAQVFRSESFDLAELPDQNQSLCLQDVTVLREFHKRVHDHNPDLMGGLNAFAWNIAPLLAQLPRQGAVRPAIDRGLLAEVQQDYGGDAQAFDAAFFEGQPLFAGALQAAAETAVEDPQPIEAAAYFDAESLRLVHGFADMMRRMMEAGPVPWFTALHPEDEREHL